MNNWSDEQGIQRALKLAYLGKGLTAPNPPVGAVLVYQGQVLLEGWHKKAGQAHAEREIFLQLEQNPLPASLLKNSTLYVTLEPCSTQGKTPSCVEGLLQSGIGRVVYGIQDPNKSHQGRADALLQAGGVEVLSGILKEPCERLLRPFTKVQQTGLPWIVVKAAFSLDGKVTRPVGESPWLSGQEALKKVHVLRGQSDAILIGGETLRTDNPKLTIRGIEFPAEKKPLWRVVVTRDKSRLPKEATIFCDEEKAHTLVFEKTPLKDVFKQLVQEYDVQQVLVEAGLSLQKQLIEEGLVDEWISIIAPRLCGGPYPAESVELEPRELFIPETGQTSMSFLPWAPPLPLKEIELYPLGKDLWLQGVVKREEIIS